MKNSKRDKIRLMEYQDAHGIDRKRKKPLHVPVRAYATIKTIFIVCIPVIYFLCSPLLIVVILAYFGLLFVTRLIEKEQNDGLKKDLRIHLPKADSLLCLLLVIVTIIGCVVGSLSMGQRKSMFEGMNGTQIEESIKGKDFSSFNFTTKHIENKIKEASTLMTGTRYLFVAEKTFGRFGGKKPNMSGEVKPSEDFNPPSEKIPAMNDMLKNMPLSIIFQSIVKAVDTALLVVLCLFGLLSLRKLKKLGLYEGLKGRKKRKYK